MEYLGKISAKLMKDEKHINKVNAKLGQSIIQPVLTSSSFD